MTDASLDLLDTLKFLAEQLRSAAADFDPHECGSVLREIGRTVRLSLESSALADDQDIQEMLRESELP